MKENNVIKEQDGTFTVNVKGKAKVTYSEPIPFLGIYEEDMENEKLAVAKNSKFKYSKGSDVAKTFRAQGWKAPTTYRNDYLFAENRLASGLDK